MERKLYEAAITGDLSLLDQQLQQRIASLSTTEENPLHTASWFGQHVDFVKEVLRLNPSLARGLNSQKLSPLHLACSKGHVETAKALVDSDPDVCFIRDQKGRTPLHIAAEKGQVEVLRALVKAQPRAAWVMTDAGDPIQHLCIKHNQIVALMDLLRHMTLPSAEMKLFLNLKDDDGNTVLHLLASKGMSQVIECFINKYYEDQLDINAVNNDGLTALDISRKYSFSDWLDTQKILLNAKAKGVEDLSNIQSMIDQGRIRRNQELENYHKWLNDTRETLMVVAILMATITFQAGLNPPGGVWQGDDSQNKNIRAGQAVMSNIAPGQYMAFIIFNSIGFIASLSLIVVLVDRFSFHQKVASWTTMVWIVVISILLIYTCSLSFLTSKNASASFGIWSGGPISCGWGLMLIGVLLLVRFPAKVSLICIFPVICLCMTIDALINSIRKRAWRPIRDLIYDKAWRPIKGLLGIRDTNTESRGDP